MENRAHPKNILNILIIQESSIEIKYLTKSISIGTEEASGSPFEDNIAIASLDSLIRCIMVCISKSAEVLGDTKEAKVFESSSLSSGE